jgi:hypothetical protein
MLGDLQVEKKKIKRKNKVERDREWREINGTVIGNWNITCCRMKGSAEIRH